MPYLYIDRVFNELRDALLTHGDHYMHLADLNSYLQADHELVKVKLLESVGDDRDTVGAALAEAVSGALAQTLGRTLLIYRARAKDPVIVLPG